ncbi:hypothetical protein [Microlunatus flavus]|uniref:Sporulation and spore germination n=1 Tax=Microlunatus flavus TaxID=1036181 RepID=A0A1H9FQG2_9ACTN|nr:hypothetical protein [Microlunatus flavus]SEQ40127.1 hypothetical protein SAMN05421756_103347 [Microlunatus flavus]
MRSDPDPSLVDALREAMRTEAGQVEPTPDGWARLQRRLAAERASTGRAAPPRPRRRAYGRAAVAVASFALVVAALVLVTTHGPQRAAVPAESPTAVPSSATQPPGGYRPSQPRVAWTLYRPGADGLVVDAARASAPYDPAQAVRALFEQPPNVPGAVAVPRNDANRVASLTVVDRAVHLDMAAVDDQTRPTGAAGRAEARRWVEAWVRTAGAAFDTLGPVVITLNGRPTTLYGVVDTTQPLFDPRTTVTAPRTIFFPAASERVTSPVGVAAMPGAVGDQLAVTDPAGRAAATATADAANGGETVMSLAPELEPGDYTVVLRSRSGQVEAQRRFTVTGSATPAGREPVTDPPTSPVETTLVYYPGPAQHLLAEPRPRTTLSDAVAAIGEEPSAEDASWPFGSLRLASVVEQGDEVVVDYASDERVRPAEPDRAVAAFWAQSLVHTVAAYVGHPVPVRVTMRGESFRLFDQLDTAEPIALRRVEERTTDGLTLPDGIPEPGALEVVGALEQHRDDVTWYVTDLVTHDTLFQGRAAVRSDNTYAFALPLPPGMYRLRVDAARSGSAPARSYGGRFEISR